MVEAHSAHSSVLGEWLWDASEKLVGSFWLDLSKIYLLVGGISNVTNPRIINNLLPYVSIQQNICPKGTQLHQRGSSISDISPGSSALFQFTSSLNIKSKTF